MNWGVRFACLMVVALGIGMVSCVKNPTKDSAPPGTIQAIDGMWEAAVLNQRVRIKIEAGRAYAEKSQELVLRDIEKISDDKYSCKTIFMRYGQFHSFLPCTAEVLSDNRLLIEVPPVPDLYNGGSETWYKVEDESEVTAAEGQDLAVTVSLSPTPDRVEASSEIVEVEPGVIVKAKKTRTVEHTVSIETSASFQSSLEAKIPAVLSSEVRGEIERQLGRSFSQVETVEQEVQLDGNVNRKYQLVWYDKVRIGTVEFADGAERQSLPFKFREWAELKVTVVND